MSLYNRIKLASSLGASNTTKSASELPTESATMRTSAVATDNSEDGYVTVEFEDGSQMEVPTLAAVSAGDEVQILVDGADAIALGSGGWGDEMNDAVMSAQTVGDEASAIANATNQHFWARSTDPDGDGVGTGAFVTDEEQDVFLEEAADGFPDYDTNTRPFHNLLMNSLGILIRKKINNLVSITKSAVAFYDGNGNSESNIIASFGSTGATIGKTDRAHMTQSSREASWYDPTGSSKVVSIGIDDNSYPAMWFKNKYHGLCSRDTTINDKTERTVELRSRSTDQSDADEGRVFITVDGTASNNASAAIHMFSNKGAWTNAQLVINPIEVRSNVQLKVNNNQVLYTPDDPASNGYGIRYLDINGTEENLALFKVITFQHTTPSIANNSGSSGWLIIKDVPTGYKAIGIVGVDSNHGYAWVSRTHKLDIPNQKIAYTYTNTSSTNQKCTFTFYLLCVPSGNVG